MIKNADGENEGCHSTRERAEAQMRALYATETRAAVDNSEWDGNAAMTSAKTASDYRSICAGEHTSGEPDERSHWALPHHKRPGAPPNAAGVRNALSRLPQTQNLKNRDAVRRHLEAHMASIRGTQNRTAEAVEIRSSSITGVDQRQRIVDLIAVPWNQEAEVFWQGELWREVFVRGAFAGIEVHAGRIRVNREHRIGDTIGKVVKLTDADEGQLAQVKIANTERGDETLALCEDDMISASVGFRIKKPSDVQINRRTHMRRVTRAFMDHLAMVEAPAYIGAQVLSVRAGQEGLQVVEQKALPATPALDEFASDPILAWATERLANNPERGSISD